MSMTIWKYPFELTAPFEILMPYGARVLSVDMQGEQPCLWALVDAENTEEPRRFVVVGTGQPAPVRGYVATFQQHPYVWHLFEIVPPES